MVGPSIADIVADLLANMHSLHPALRDDLINYSALARHLKPHVQEKLGKKDVSEDAIVMAARRYVASAFSAQKSKDSEHMLSRASLLVRQRMVNVYFKRTSALSKKLGEFAAAKVRWDMGEKMYVIQRTEEISVIASHKFLPELLRLAPEKQVLSFLEHLTALTVVYDEPTISTPGLYLFLLQKLEGINVVTVFSTYRMTTVLLSEEDAPKAYDRLNRELIQLRNTYKFQPGPQRFGYED